MLSFLLEKEPHALNWEGENDVNSKEASTRSGKLTHAYIV